MSEATTASGADSSTTSTILTPPESVFTGSANEHEGGSSSAPWPGATYIIQSREYGQVITLVDGQPILAPLGSGERGSMYWKCIDHQGWLGFKNSASGGLSGEHLCVRPRPEGGYVLLMTHRSAAWIDLRPMGLKKIQGKAVLAKLEGPADHGMTWYFIKV
ncbi:hypothetical protein BCR34DRAFT_602444 [Clohesyomyces aquaticus]|uniref:Ricin B lectin domain-containing protein n=1 Tax=Clohesyomyces aquaticus TaxID=1231657 RepID=A0A1Y1ZID8_9PLEO|nr:hypothetical protein BCR34DRAFT_602444 [Clohesyomyces aquaticus]